MKRDLQTLVALVSLALIADNCSSAPLSAKQPDTWDSWTDSEWLQNDKLMINYQYVERSDDGSATGRAIELKFPYFNPNVRPLGEKLGYIVKDHTRQAIGQILITMKSRMESNSYFDSLKAGAEWTALGWRLVGIGLSQRSKSKYLDTKIGTGGKFNREMGALFENLVLDANREAERLKKSKTRLSKKEFYDELSFLLNHLANAIDQSPVGPYVKWSKGTVNDENFCLYSAKLMGKARALGVGELLSPMSMFFKRFVG